MKFEIQHDLARFLDKHPKTRLLSWYYSGNGTPNRDKNLAGYLCATDESFELYDLLKVMVNYAPKLETIHVYLDCCGAAGAYYSSITNIQNWCPNFEQLGLFVFIY